MEIDKIHDDIAGLLEDKSLFEETNLRARNKTIDFIDYACDLLKIPGYTIELDPLYQQALKLREDLCATNEALYERVRVKLQNGDFTPESLRDFFDRFTIYSSGELGQPEYENDSLDALLEKVIYPKKAPIESRKRAAGMIRYEATPARVILELTDRLRFTPDDVFFDLGSGLGLVVILIQMLTGVPSIGIEYDPAYCEYARSCAEELNLQNVTFIQNDARSANLNSGNIFYLFTPFVNEIFDSVLERLRYTAIRKEIYICSYGTITFDLTKLPWLQIRDPAMEHDFKLAIFTSK